MESFRLKVLVTMLLACLIVFASCGSKVPDEPFEWDGMEEVVRNPLDIALAIQGEAGAGGSVSEEGNETEASESPFAGEVIGFAAHADFFLRHGIRRYADLLYPYAA